MFLFVGSDNGASNEHAKIKYTSQPHHDSRTFASFFEHDFDVLAVFSGAVRKQ